jgi:hypothetical protein
LLSWGLGSPEHLNDETVEELPTEPARDGRVFVVACKGGKIFQLKQRKEALPRELFDLFHATPRHATPRHATFQE